MGCWGGMERAGGWEAAEGRGLGKEGQRGGGDWARGRQGTEEGWRGA